MDNNRPPENIHTAPRVRKDSMTPEQRRSMQQGFPTRKNASTTLPPSANRRPQNDGTIPNYMRHGEVPLRAKQAVSAKHSDTVTSTRSPDANRAISSGIPTRPIRHNPEDAAADTITLDRRALNRLASQNKSFDQNAVTTVLERPTVTGTKDKTAKDKGNDTAKSIRLPAFLSRITPTGKSRFAIVASVVVILMICILLPLSLSAKQNVEPDFDMTEGAMDNANYLSPLTHAQALPTNDKFQVTLDFFDKEDISVSTSAITLSALLDELGYSPIESDRFPCTMETELTEETILNIDTVLYSTVEESAEIPYASQVVDSQTVPRGSTQVVQQGKNGTKTLTYSVELVNGKEVSRTLISEVVETQPVNEISHHGIGGTFVGNDGKTYSYSYYRIVNATYYNLTGPTYLGYNADESVIAVDPNYIPLGTKLYVKNDKYDFGVRTAADTGSMIIGWEVDIWIGDDNPQLPAFAYTGYHYDMRVYYLD